MKSKVTQLLHVLPALALSLALAAAAAAQQPSPSPQKSASAQTQSPAPDAEEAGPYTVTSSVEIGYRGLSVDGSVNKYRSDLHYKAGLRLFDSSLLMQAKHGEGQLFDTFLVTTSGWGADPSGHMRLSAEKSEWYRFDANYRRFRYYRYLNNFANPNYFPAANRQAAPDRGLHNYDTRQQVGDFDLTLLPKNDRLRVNLGYSPARNSGPVYTTTRGGGDEFMMLANTRWRSNDFRLGADWKLGPVDFSFMQGLRRFRDDSQIDNEGLANAGHNPAATNVSYTSFLREQPVRGSVNYTRLSAHTLVAKRLDLTGRIVYGSATTRFNFLEELSGRNFNPRISVGGAQWPALTGNTNTPNTTHLVRYVMSGDTKRPSTLADFGVTYLATDRLRLSNTFRVETYQLNGGAVYDAFFDMTYANNRRTISTAGYSYEAIKYRKVQNTVEGDYQFSPRYSARFGYRHARRWREEVIDGYNLGSNQPTPRKIFEEEESNTNAFFGGVRARPLKGWSLSFNAERGTADHVFTRTGGNYDYTNIRARSRYQPSRNLSLNVGYVTRNNSTPAEIEGVSLADFGAETKSRVFTSSVEWTAHPDLSFSAAYNNNWAESDTVVRYAYSVPPASAAQGGVLGRSLYFSRNHYFSFDTVARPFRRVTVYAAYRINKDSGQGDRLPDLANGLLVASYPMSFQSPEARVAFRVNRKVDLNLGYSYYNYNESDLVRTTYSFRPQNYHAHQPYASLRFYFGGGR